MTEPGAELVSRLRYKLDLPHYKHIRNWMESYQEEQQKVMLSMAKLEEKAKYGEKLITKTGDLELISLFEELGNQVTNFASQ